MPKPLATIHKTLTRRAFIFGALNAGVIGALASRLYYLQFIRAADFQTLSENNRIKLQIIPPPRGRLLDRRRVPFVLNQENYQLFIEAGSMPFPEVERTLHVLAGHVAISEKKIKQVLQDLKAWPFSPPVLLRENLTWEELSRVELHLFSLPGVTIDVGQVRHYPFKEKAAHLTGYVGAVSPEDDPDQPLLRLPEFKIGKSGVEKMLEDRLRGTAGVRHMEVNVYGLSVRELARKESVPGEDVPLTVDSRLQEYAADRIGEESASVVVMNVKNGNVLALATMPAYDPNSFSKGIASDYWKALNADPKAPLLNKAIAGQYAPGSTFKMMGALAALEHKAITRSSTVFCPGHFYLGNHQFNCWKEGGHGTVDVVQAIAQSCDTFFYTMAQRLGIEKIAEMARRFGLGVMHNIGLPGEKQSPVPDPEWKMKRFKQKWQAGDTINVGIGQGYILSTPLQLAVMTARIAGGYSVKPRLVAGVPHESEEALRGVPLGVDPDHLDIIRAGMNAVTNEPGGTAYGRRITEERFAMAGKTGTSQVIAITQRGVRQESLPWKFRHHALFVGYAPVHNPLYACAVMVEHGGGGSVAAAPIARDVLLKIQQMEEEDGRG